MRTLIAPVILLLCVPMWAQIGYDHAVWDDIAWRERPGMLLPVKSGGAPTRGYDLHYHELHWTIDPAVRAISGWVGSHFTTTTDVQDLLFDLSDTLFVDSIVYHGAPLATWTLATGDVLTITLPALLLMGTVDSIRVHYHGVPRTTGFGSFEQAWHDTLPERPLIWTLSEPYGAKDWWPCKQDLNDKIDSIDAWVTVPDSNRAAGNGLLVSSISAGGWTTHHWRHRYPIDAYLIATAVTNYQELIHQVILPNDTVLMLSYAFPEHAYYADLNAGDVLQQMPLYSQLFGTYPFADEKYGHAQMGWGGGMEHQTMTFLGGYWYELAAHELAHQWFGDKVTCGSWEDIWLNEGFATYLTGLCYEHLAPQYWHGWLGSKIDDIISAPDGSVFCTDTTSVGRIFDGRLTYNKGAMVLHMLRWVCGDSAFYGGIRNYLDDPTLAYGTALTADLQAHLESESGLDLDGFMADWFTGEGFPTYTLIWTQDIGGNISAQLDQATSDLSVDFFEMPVPIRFKNGSQDSTVVLDHTFSGQAFNFHLPFQADSALFDPDRWLVSGQNLVLRVPVASFGNEQVLLFPNPLEDVGVLYVSDALQGEATVVIFDGSGRLVQETSLVFSHQRAELDARTLAPGHYVAELNDGDQLLRIRFVKD